MIWWWIIILTLPLLLALSLTADEPTRVVGRWLAPWASLPAVAVALLWPTDYFVAAEWMLLGGHFGLDGPARLFMLLTAALWTIAGVFARQYLAKDPKRDRFWIFYLLTMTGNLGLVGAFDIAGFYLFFALMTFCAFGLVIHEETMMARFAARVYMAMAILGEAALLLGLVMAAHAAMPDWDLRVVGAAIAGDPRRNLIVGLLLAGFGIKAGAIFLHMWLPLAHPAAPVPASAVLSGAMIKAGLIGWLRFFSGGEVAMVGWGSAVTIMGIVAAFYGVALGLGQTNPKTNLAYSSISQMGYMSVAVGIGLMQPDLWPLAVTAASIYALHHGMAKGALFLGVGVARHAVHSRAQRWLLMIGLTVAALALAGAPLTSGYLAKTQLKAVAANLPQFWHFTIETVLPLAAMGTTLLLGRFLWLIYVKTADAAHGYLPKHGLWAPWIAAIVLVVCLPWATLWWFELQLPTTELVSMAKLWTALWPVLLGGGLVALAMRLHWAPRRWKVFPGDIIVFFNRLIHMGIVGWGGIVIPTSTQVRSTLTTIRNRTLMRIGRWMSAGEITLVRWGSGGAMFVLLTLVLIVLLILAR